ncbi:hypothetical protein A3195_07005 [Candidatus Thiodiazotropha endoloripes]|nr:hypothetical protein A3195_07005 [Candidatus Thiodiazotropha endoloripes]
MSCCARKSAKQGARSVVWLFQMSDEQRFMALFQAQPLITISNRELGLFLRPVGRIGFNLTGPRI